MVRTTRPLVSGNCITHERRGQWVCACVVNPAAWQCWLQFSKKRAVSLESFNSSLTSKLSKSGQLEQHLSLLQIKCVEAFGEPVIDRGEDVAGFIPLGKAHCTRRVDDGCP
jgi:hypothetical protein